MGSIGQRVMVKLVNKLGGVEQASQVLDIRSSILMRFIDGTMQVPDAVLLKTVDYVLDDAPPLMPKAVVPPRETDEAG